MPIFSLCPKCRLKINFGLSPTIGQRVVCPECGSNFDIVWLYPLTVDIHNDSTDIHPGKHQSVEGGSDLTSLGTSS